MKQYLDLVETVLAKGNLKKNRTGVDTLSLFNYNYDIDLQEGFPLLTTKHVSWKNIVVENLWFLSGDWNVSFLRKHECKFWEPWTNEAGNVPSAYGAYWRESPDQIRWVLDELKNNPISRRLVVSAWDPFDGPDSALPPCHLMFILNVQDDHVWGPRLNLHLTQRSADIALGVPYNIAGYAFLLHLFSRFSGIKVGKFAHSIVDAHIYVNHIHGLMEQLSREPNELPNLKIDPNIQSLEDLKPLYNLDTTELMNHFLLEGYEPHPAIKFDVAV